MLTPEPKSAKHLTTFQSEAEQPRSLSAIRALEETAPGRVRIRWSRRGGQAFSVRGMLTEPGEGSGEEIAEGFLTEHHDVFGIPAEDSGLRITEVKEQRGVQHVKYQQFYKTMPVVGAEMTIHIDQAKRVQMVNGTYCSGIAVAAPETILSEEAAVDRVLRELHTTDVSIPRTEAVIFPQGAAYIQAYAVTLHSRNPLGDWVYFVDAVSGEIVDRYNAINFGRGQGKLYNTNPKRDQDLMTAGLLDLDDSGALSGTYFLVRNAAVNSKNAAPTGPGTYDFFYDISDPHFDEVMVYYHLSRVNRFFRNMGYTEHAAPMSAYVHVPDPNSGEPNYDNAYFSPLKKSVFFGHGDELNDLAQEAAVIYHEYSHSVIDSIQPFMGTAEAGALHEGYADYFACSLTEDSKVGEYAVAKLGEAFLRDLRNGKTYDDFSGSDVHADGEIWGATCWKIRETLGRHITDILLYESLWYLPSNATLLDACEGILQADTQMFQGAYADQIHTVLKEQNLDGELPDERVTIVANAGQGGSISPSGAISLDKGSSQTFSIQADFGYDIQHVLVDGSSVGTVTSYTFDDLSASHSIEAFFKERDESVILFTITATAGSGGTIEPNGDARIVQGAEQQFTITPDAGYSIRHVLVDGVSAGAIAEYTFKTVSAAHTIEAVFDAVNQKERTVSVPGNAAWFDSGLDLETGDIIYFTASGTIVYDSKGNACQPDGSNWQDVSRQQDPVWQSPHGGLIGKIEGIGAPFFIGSSYAVRAGSSGRLLLGINDRWTQGNSGAFSVTIRVV